MAEKIDLKKRLIGREDINFDFTGTNETASFTAPDGTQKEVTKINASHIPLTKETAARFSAKNVEDAFFSIQSQIDDFEAVDVLTEDITVNFDAADDDVAVQGKIDQQKKNLNGHTVTFKFPAGTSYNIFQSLVWEGFFNGTVILSGGDADFKIPIYDLKNIGAIFHIRKCLCSVVVRYFYFIHQYSPYAVNIEDSPAVTVHDCVTSGVPDSDSYAFYKNGANLIIKDCSYSNDKEFLSAEVPDRDLDGRFSELDSKYLSLKGGNLSGGIVFETGAAVSRNNNDTYISVCGGKDADNGAFLRVFGKGISSAAGVFNLSTNDGTNKKALVGRPNGSLTWDGKDVSGGFPNYVAGVEVVVERNTYYTVPEDGWLSIYVYGDEVVPSYFINDVFVACHGTGHYNHSSIFVPVKKGDKGSCTHRANFTFFPNK